MSESLPRREKIIDIPQDKRIREARGKPLTYNYAPGRDKEVADELASGFSGILMTDAYASYNKPSRDARYRAGRVYGARPEEVRRRAEN